MNKFYKFMNIFTVTIFSASALVYMFLSFVTPEIALQQHYLVVSLLSFIAAHVCYEKH